MKTSKFPDKLIDQIFGPEKISDTRLSEKQITNSRKFKVALFAAYSSLIAIFALIIYTAIILDPRFPF